MTTNSVREILNSHIGKEAKIKYSLGRNKYEKYDGTIKEIYKNIFLVELNNKEIKSFSYSDVITKTIKIDF